MKNLTLEQNIRQIQQNNVELYQQTSIEHPHLNGYNKPEDIIVMPDVLSVMFDDVANRVRQELGEDTKIHLYGLTTPVTRVQSDYGDISYNLVVEEVPYQTIESIGNYLVSELLDDKEVYIFSIPIYKICSPTHFEPQVRYLLRSKSIPRGLWTELTVNGGIIQEPEDRLIQPPTDKLVQNSKLKKHKF